MKNKKAQIAALLLICLVAVIINNSFFLHFHTLTDGRVISHSHFYKNGFGSKNAPVDHKHSDAEFEFIKLLNNIFSNASIAAVTVFILISSLSIVGLFYSFKLCFYRIEPYNLRAPPVL